MRAKNIKTLTEMLEKDTTLTYLFESFYLLPVKKIRQIAIMLEDVLRYKENVQQ